MNIISTHANKSNEIYLIKAFSIISVVSAHSHFNPDRQGGFAWYSALFLRNIGIIGVICFLIVAGYLYHPEKYPLNELVKRKAKTIGIPWLLTGFVYHYWVEGMKITSAVKKILGIGSCLYYLVMLVFCFILFYAKAARKKSVCFVLIITTVFSTVFFYDVPFKLFLQPLGYHVSDWVGYLNPLNWVGYFAIGVAAQNELEKIKRWIYNPITLVICGFVLTACVVHQLMIGAPESYFLGGTHFLIRLSGLTTVFCMAHLIENKRHHWKFIYKILVELGKDSYSVYLLHLFVVHYFISYMNQPFVIYFVLLRPLVIIAIIVGLDILIRKVKNTEIREILCTILGIR